MKVKVTMEVVLTADKAEMEIIRKLDASGIVGTSILQNAPVAIHFTKADKNGES
jgi:hypothetical protein